MTENNTAHSSLPWVYAEFPTEVRICTNNILGIPYMEVASIDLEYNSEENNERGKKDFKHIVNCVNSHKALVDALREFRMIFDCDVLNLSPAALSLYVRKAEAALKRAGAL